MEEQDFNPDWTPENEEEFLEFIRDCERANPGSMGYDYDDYMI